tara:strand:- start:1106 stop:1210 length:105 start_codon:yes stop_codon:yes gene_type:complete
MNVKVYKRKDDASPGKGGPGTLACYAIPAHIIVD